MGILLIVLLTSLGCQTSPETSSKQTYELLWKRHEIGEYGSGYIVGQVKVYKDYNYAQISFNLYDDSGNRVGTAWDNVNNLKAGDVWSFRAMILDDRAGKYAFAEFSGW